MPPGGFAAPDAASIARLKPASGEAEPAHFFDQRVAALVVHAAGDLGRARRYGWPADRQAILAETLAAARARFAALKSGTETHAN